MSFFFRTGSKRYSIRIELGNSHIVSMMLTIIQATKLYAITLQTKFQWSFLIVWHAVKSFHIVEKLIVLFFSRSFLIVRSTWQLICDFSLYKFIVSALYSISFRRLPPWTEVQLSSFYSSGNSTVPLAFIRLNRIKSVVRLIGKMWFFVFAQRRQLHQQQHFFCSKPNLCTKLGYLWYFCRGRLLL